MAIIYQKSCASCSWWSTHDYKSARRQISEVDFGHVHSKHLTITGARLRSRSITEKSEICRSLETNIWPKFADGTISPETYAVFSFADASKAHRLMEASRHIGKILLVP